MSKVAIASCYDKFNYGSMLQAYATQLAIENLGHEAITLDKSGLGEAIAQGRRKYYEEHLFDLKLYQAKLGFVMHRVRQKTNKRFGQKMNARYQQFRKFSATHFYLSPIIHSFEELSEYCCGFDDVVVGSDQLWLPVNIAGNYYTLSFVPEGVRKVSYATSFGVSQLPKPYLERAKQFLSTFDAISVREETGARIVESLGDKAEVVCDPTMLLDAKQWSHVADDSYHVPETPYVFCYFMGKNAWNRECVKKLAKERNLAVVAISHLDEYVPGDDRDFANFQPYDVGPAQWVQLLRNAAYVCTDSFHGSVFSSIYERPFFAFRRHENMGNQSTNSRLDTLLGRLGLMDRLCQTPEEFDQATREDIDWAMAGENLEKFMATSTAFLADALEQD